MTLFGSDAPVIDLVRYPRLAYARRFNSGQLADVSTVPAQVRPHVSLNTDGRPLDPHVLETWLERNDGRAGDLTLDHEVNTGKKGTPTQFKANMRVAADMLKGTTWRLVEILGLWQMVNKSDGGFATWHSPDAQACGVDAYVPGGAKSLPSSVPVWLAPALKYWGAYDLPRLICEWGYNPASDPTGRDGARLARQMGRFAKDNKLDACAAWDNPKSGAPGVPDGAYVFTGDTLVAWQTVVEVG
jgi:hypothetical protein